MTREPVLLSWIKDQPRSHHLANALGATEKTVAIGRSGQRWSVPIRYALQTARTLRLLHHLRPAVLITVAPPHALTVVARLWTRLTGIAWVVDAHTAAIASRHSGRLRRISLRLMSTASAVIVTNEELRAHVGTRNFVVIDDPPAGTLESSHAATTTADAGALYVWPMSWHADEPVSQLFGAAALLPERRFVLTGHAPRRVDPPQNVSLCGWLPVRDYEELLATATAVLALTTADATIQRSAYDAIDRHIPVIASDRAVLRSILGDAAVFTDDSVSGLVAAVRALDDRWDEVRSATIAVQESRRERLRQSFEDLSRMVPAVRSQSTVTASTKDEAKRRQS